MKNNKVIFKQISCPANRYKRYELKDGDTVCPACGQVKDHYIYGLTTDDKEIKVLKEEK